MKRLLRLLLDLGVPLLTIAACVVAYRWGILPLVEGVISLDPTQTTILRRVGVTAALFIGYLAVARYYERRALTELAPQPLAAALAASCGVLLIGVTISILFALGHYRVLAFRDPTAALPVIGAICIGVVFEEVVFRGIVFRVLERHAGSLPALTLQATIFGALHLFNEGTSPVTVVSVTLLGALWTTIFVYSRNLWVVIAHHAAWNVTIFVSGVPLSGQEAWRSAAPLVTSSSGPPWLTGGGFGPEDSAINLLVTASAFAALGYHAHRRGSLVAPRWRV